MQLWMKMATYSDSRPFQSSFTFKFVIFAAIVLLPNVILNFTLPPQNNNSDYFDNENDEIAANQTNSDKKEDVDVMDKTDFYTSTTERGECNEQNCNLDNSSSTTAHAPLFGIIPRECPQDPLPEIFPVRQCTKDDECWPRICCFESNDIDTVGYCRIATMPIWDRLPMARVISPFKSAMMYWQCTPPPPPDYDFFPKQCRSTFDCFPNLCCQEKDKKVCRPPRRSLLTLISNFAQQRESWFG